MKWIDFTPILVFVLTIQIAVGQSSDVDAEAFTYEDLPTLEDSLAVFAYGVLKDTNEMRRFASCKELILGLKRALKVENSFQYKFPKLNTLSIQYPQDSSFRIFTWQLYVNKDDYRYYGAIQMNTPELELIPLIDRSYQLVDLHNLVTTPDAWYGAVYYNIHEVDSPNGKYYILFGFDGYQFFRKRKVMDVLSFEDGKVVFGKHVFKTMQPNGMVQPESRIVMEYSAEASTRLNYDPLLEMIVQDFLIEQEGKYGEGIVKYPDGSYIGYQLESDGTWKFIPKIFDQVSEEPPRPFPILEGKSSEKDIFGRKKKNNN